MCTFFTQNKKGFGLIEIIVGVAVLSTSLLAISFFYQRSLEVSREAGRLVQASFLLEEGIEAVKIMRDNNWQDIANLATSTDYFLLWNSTTWATSTTNTFIDSLYERKLTLDDVYRDSNEDIVLSGGTLDTKTKKVTINVSWSDKGATSTKSIDTYFADIFN